MVIVIKETHMTNDNTFINDHGFDRVDLDGKTYKVSKHQMREDTEAFFLVWLYGRSSEAIYKSHKGALAAIKRGRIKYDR
jgi:hypothetical protein